MRLCSIKNLLPGHSLAKDIHDDRLDLVVAAGIPLNERMISRLKTLEIDDVYIHEEGTDDIIPDDMISDKTRRKTHKVLRRAFDDLQNLGEMTDWANEDIASIIQFDDRYENSIAVPEFREIVHLTIEDMFVAGEAVFETPMVKSYLNRNYEHSLNTSMLSIMLGRSFGYAQEELTSLGMAAMLHDVGKLVVPNLNGRSLRKLDPPEQKLYRKHPAIGAAILGKTAPKANLERAAILQHHEQQDGRGYPGKLRGNNDAPIKGRTEQPGSIFRFAEIITIANVFDNLLNGELLADPMSPVEAVENLVRGAGFLYNRAIVSRAVEIINTYPVGAIVEVQQGNNSLHPGMRGVVRKGTSAQSKRPLVTVLWDRKGSRIDPIYIDLNKWSSIEIILA